MANDVQVRITGDNRDLTKAIDDSKRKFKDLGSEADKATRRTRGGFRRALSSVNLVTPALGAIAGGLASLGRSADKAFGQWESSAKSAVAATVSAINQLVNFDDLNRQQLVDLGRAAAERLRAANQALDNAGIGVKIGENVPGARQFARIAALFNDRLRSQLAQNQALLTERERAQELVSLYTDQLALIDERNRAQRELSTQGIPTNADPEALPTIRPTQAIEGLRQLAAAQLEVVGATNQLIAAEDLRQVQAIRGNTLLAEQQRQYDLLFQKIGALDQAALQLADSGARAVADLALGFGSLQEVLEGVKQTIRGIVQDLLAAAAKAAILSILFPGTSALAGGFGGLFRGFLGLTPFASGGIVTGPTPALIGERGPEAVIPLDRLGSAMGQARTAEITMVRFDGRDFLIALREASNVRDLGPSISFS